MAPRNKTYFEDYFSIFYGWAAGVIDIPASAAAEILGETMDCERE